MSSGLETSRFNKNADEVSARNCERFLDFAPNDKNGDTYLDLTLLRFNPLSI
jgi:hypothetical protein